jgi:uncharacterized protein YegJ (DUF2314 family)
MRFSPATYLIKVPILDRSETGEKGLIRTPEVAAKYPTQPICHLWLAVTSVLDDLVFGTVGEAPEELGLKKGASFVVDGDLVEDWMINHRGEVYGGFSLRLIRSRLRESEQLRFDKHTGIRKFKKLLP